MGFDGTDVSAWEKEFKENINPIVLLVTSPPVQNKSIGSILDYDDPIMPSEWLEEFEKMEPAERQFILDELSAKPELWDTDEGVIYI